MQIFHWDGDSDRVWGWKSDLPAARLAYYGKALAGRPAFVSLEMLPCLMASVGSENLAHLYAHGGISYEAKRIYDVLESLGPQPTRALRLRAGLDSKDGNVRYHSALDELQRRMFVMPVGATNEGSNWVSQIFELVARWFPTQAERARRLDASEARRALIARYLRTVIAAKRPVMARVLGIPRAELDAVVERFSSRKLVRVEGEWVIMKRSLMHLPSGE